MYAQLSWYRPEANNLSQFGSIVVNGMGFSVFNTLLVSMLAFVFQGIFVVLACGGCTLKENTRTYWMTLMMVISVVGAVMIRKVAREYKWTRLMGYCLTAGFSANLVMVLAMVTGNTAGFTKKTTVNAMVFPPLCEDQMVTDLAADLYGVLCW